MGMLCWRRGVLGQKVAGGSAGRTRRQGHDLGLAQWTEGWPSLRRSVGGNSMITDLGMQALSKAVFTEVCRGQELRVPVATSLFRRCRSKNTPLQTGPRHLDLMRAWSDSEGALWLTSAHLPPGPNAMTQEPDRHLVPPQTHPIPITLAKREVPTGWSELPACTRPGPGQPGRFRVASFGKGS